MADAANQKSLKTHQSTEKSGLTKIETTSEYDEYFELHFLSRKRFSFTRRNSPTAFQEIYSLCP